MGSKKHRNHTRQELMEARESDEGRRNTAKKPVDIGKPYAIGPTVLFNPFRRNRTPGGIILLRPKK